MDALIPIDQAQALSPFTGLTGSPLLPPEQWQGADRHLLVVRDRTAIAAQASLWWRETPSLPGHRIGVIGHYAVANREATLLLLQAAVQQLGEQHCTLVVGPMDGNTWRRYRLLSDRGTEPPFFLEPDNPVCWCEPFQMVGFTPLATYHSALTTDLTQRDPRLEAVERRLQQTGVQVRSLHLPHFEPELKRIYHLSGLSFRQNFLYTPLDWSEFFQQYRQIQDHIQPDLVLMAEQDGKLVGFLFAVPNWLQRQRAEPLDTVIIKTVAVLPGRQSAGLGNLLVARAHGIAHELGYRRAIHALMHDRNPSRHLSARYAHPIRRYTLFGKVL